MMVKSSWQLISARSARATNVISVCAIPRLINAGGVESEDGTCVDIMARASRVSYPNLLS
jgi:hypothetical protein